MSDLPFITIVLPCRNEEHFIQTTLQNILNQNYPKGKAEIFVIDGNSIDQTRHLALKVAEAFPFIKVINNPNKTVPYALNLGIKAANGKYIIRLDAHTQYADDYFLKVVETFEKTGAEIVGGPMRAIGKTPFQRTVAICTSTKFGVGDSKFHDEDYRGYTDSVYLGAWRREIFSTVGMFDEQMMRNQDDEFHYRAKSHGMKIYLNPEIRSWYYPRSDFTSLAKQYFQYGLFKPLVLKKVKSGIKMRHLIPSAFLMYFAFIFFLLVIGWTANGFLLLPAVAYILLDIYFSFLFQKSIKEKFISLLIYPALHFSYGLGFLSGLTKGKS